tara:strand:- start:1410 stop:2126 length:717 start_codon:yes stop_codon:yes gene_type:complete
MIAGRGINTELQGNVADKSFVRNYNEYVIRPQPIDYVLSFFDNKKEGTFIDIGAYDGVKWSNSLVLEEELGWEGVCIEANVNSYEKCEGLRSSITLNKAVCSAFDDVTFRNVIGGASCLSCIVEFVEKKHLQRINSEIEKLGGSYTDVSVETITLNEIFDKFVKGNSVDYLSIDAEGSEYEIFKNFNFDIYSCSLISVEYNGSLGESERDSDSKVTTLLKNNGYKPICKVAGDLFFSK